MENTVDGKTVLCRSHTGRPRRPILALCLYLLAFSLTFLSAAFVFFDGLRLGLIVFVLAACIFLLGRFTWRNYQSARRWRIEIEPGEILIDLPVERSVTEPQQRIRRLMELSHIACVETRLEVYQSFGVTNMQRSYAFRMRSGELIMLGKDRALTTPPVDHTMGQTVETIRLKTGLALRDLGMVASKAGLLGGLFTAIPPWDSHDTRIMRTVDLWRGAVLTVGTTGIAIIIGLILAAMF
ncbi:hypothetical protein [Hyphomonas sp.]|uniref:hypothetical protein n=1 Tax=Hyphomonas sp. TaxID=87 RepID=UPI0032EE82C5